MTKQTYDVAIVGLGAMGSAAAYHLARRGVSVIGFDAHTPPHGLGSTHGESRIIREAYFEHPLYVPLIQRAYECWRELESEYGQRVLLQVGGLMIGPIEGVLVGGARLSADRHHLEYDLLSAADIRKKFPVLQPTDDVVGLFEPRAGILLPERCVEAHLAIASRHGAELNYNEAVTAWEATKGGVKITTQAGEYHAGKVVLAPGPWIGRLLPEPGVPLTIERQVLYWYNPGDNAALFGLDRLPIYAWEYTDGALFYGFPNVGTGVKIALHHQGVATDADSVERNVSPEEIGIMQTIVETFLPKLDGPLLRTEVCMYTNTPDEHFIIDWVPGVPRALAVSACSGHGFKFASVIGEIVGDLVTDGRAAFDLGPFSIGRFAEGSS